MGKMGSVPFGTEYSIKNSYLMLQQLVDEIPNINGIVAYSLFQMPENQEKRLQIITFWEPAGINKKYKNWESFFKGYAVKSIRRK